MKRFFSLQDSRKAEGRDFFVQVINPSTVLYMFPPVNQIGRTLRKIVRERLRGVIIVPEWPTQAWWPLLCGIRHKRTQLGTEALVPTQAARELPPGTMWLAAAIGI